MRSYGFSCSFVSVVTVGKTPDDYGSGGECGLLSPSPAFKEVWQVKLWPKGLGQARNLIGIYRLCLTDSTVNFVKLNSDAPAVALQLMNVRRCGHSENFFFIEVGRSAMTGPGEFWMQVEDSVVAQNMHETLLEAMKALSEEFRQRSKTQAVGTSCGGGTASNPISVPSRRHHPNLPPSQVGFSRRARTETPGVPHSTNTSPTSRHGFSRSRTASIGARTDDSSGRITALSTSPSLNGSSCSTTPTLRAKPTRAPTPAKITLSLAPYTPKNPAPSPAPSLSSSSGHGSECGLSGAPLGTVPICTYARIPQRVSMSGSPSDYGSSDEYGSSPGEHSLLAAGLSTALADGSTNCVLIGHRDSSHKRVHGRRIFRRSSNREYEPERRLLNKCTSLPPSTAQERVVPHCREEEDEEDEDYAVMSRSTSRESFASRRGSGSSVTPSGQVENSANKGVNTKEGLENTPIDSGYMSMLPGVTAPASLSLSVSETEPKGGDEYMTMTPNSSVSPPQNIRLPVSEGYMMMSPHSSCSPDLHGMSGCLWGSRSSMESRAGSDYMNMSPISARSACSTPPSHPEQHPLQPKTVYSYFSLPRSYKHTTLSTRFEDNLGDGRRPESISRGEAGSRRRSGRGGYPNRTDSSVGPNGGGNLSLSSSSFSSSSASTESLEDKPLTLPPGVIGKATRSCTVHRVGGVHSKDSAHHFHQQRRGPGVQKQGHPQQRKGRPFSLFVDMSKANTLPRVKEAIQPLVSQSSGEYVSIVYQSDQGNRGITGVDQGSTVVQGHSRALYQPSSCQLGGTNLPRSFSAPLSTSISVSSEYVNMDLGHSTSPLSCTSLSSFNPTQAITPKASENLVRAPQVAQEAEKGHKMSSMSNLPSGDMSGAPFTEYTEMAFGLARVESPKPGQTAEPSSIEQEQTIDFHSPKTFPKLDQGARLVRAESSARRRHRSDTFKSPPGLSLSPSSSSSIFAETPQTTAPRCHGLESSLWATGQTSAPQVVGPGLTAQAASLPLEQGLNYIDLDLAGKDNPQMSLEGSSGPHFTVLGEGLTVGLGGIAAGGSSNSSINTYASIDFFKSEELRVHQNTRKDSKGL